MKRMICLAATVVIGSMGLVGCDRNNQASDTNPNTANPPGQTTANNVQSAADKTGTALNNAAHNTGAVLSDATTRTADLAQNAGAKMSGNDSATNDNVAPDASGIRDELSRITNAALTKDNFSGLVKDLSTDSQNRIGDFSKQDFADLNGIIAQIQGDWKTKYGHDFNETSDALAVANIVIRQGSAAAGSNVPRGNESGIGNANSTDSTGVVTLSMNATNLTIPVIKQGILRDWYIDLPASVTGQKLHDNLSKELTAVKDSQAQWPSDENAAYRVVSTHILAAIMDTPAK